MLEGNVDISLAGKSETLTPTLGAAIALNAKHGSFGALLAKLENYDLQACADTVHHGLSRAPSERDSTVEQVFNTGLVEIAPDLVSYVVRLVNGGKPLKPAEEEEAKGPFGE